MIGNAAQHVPTVEVAAELRACRERARLSQAKLALALGVSRRTISRWEGGRGRIHQVYLRRIRALGQTGAQQEATDALKQVQA